MSKRVMWIKNKRIPLCDHFFPSPLVWSLEWPQLELTSWMQILGIVLGMLEIQWPVFMHRTDLTGRGAFDAYLWQNGRSPFSTSGFKFGLTIVWCCSVKAWCWAGRQQPKTLTSGLVREECPAVSTEQPCHFSANPPRTIRKEDKVSAALLGLPLRV